MDKTLIAQTVANKLFATENAVDAAIVEATKLMAGLIEARKDMGLSAVVGSAIDTKLAAALSALTEARSEVVAAHNEMADVKLRIGIRTKLIGVTDKSAAISQNDLMVAHRRAS